MNGLKDWECPYYHKDSKTCEYVDLNYYECNGYLTYYSISEEYGCDKIKVFAKTLEEIINF